ncbi:MAG: sulfotransferase [Acidobacteria bacterium]|nr:sulfotransferase [Acidobacteriota bacterium]
MIGCHRSGTNLLYDILLSAGGFAIYRGHLPVYEVLIPRFGGLQDQKNRRKIMQVWLRSKGFRRSELDRKQLAAKILADCRSGGDFIRIHMEEIARRQHVERWAVYDPDTVHFMREVKQEIPEALFLHIIRDGRDIALSLKKMGGFKPFPWDRENRSLNETALYWRWTVEKGREYGRQIPNDYMEVHYEGLIRKPHENLAELGRFLDHELDYARIQATGLGRLRESNSSFRDEGQQSRSAVERWKERLSATEIAELEALIGDTLEQFGYSRMTARGRESGSLRLGCLRSLYPAILNGKFWLKTHTLLGKFANLSVLELEPENPDQDQEIALAA